MADLKIIGIDLAKNSFQVHGINKTGRKLFNKKLSRSKIADFISQQPPCRIAMEACASAHYWARKFQSCGHEVVLIAPQFVKPYVKNDKSDSNDAEAICEAASRDHMRFVPIKAVRNQDLSSLATMRQLCIKNTTALSNQIRGLLAEYGVVAPQGKASLRTLLAELCSLQSESIDASKWGDLSPVMIAELSLLYEELQGLDQRISDYDKKIEGLAKSDPRYDELVKVPGIGPLTAAAILGSVTDANLFKNARQFAAWLGLVPRQHSTGGKQTLLGITKRGDRYLRTLFVHGARVLLNWPPKGDLRREWAHELKDKKGANKAAVALANKTARVVWAMLATGKPYDPKHKPSIGGEALAV